MVFAFPGTYHIDQRHSEVCVNFLVNLPVQLFFDNCYMHIVNLDVDDAVVEGFRVITNSLPWYNVTIYCFIQNWTI